MPGFFPLEFVREIIQHVLGNPRYIHGRIVSVIFEGIKKRIPKKLIACHESFLPRKMLGGISD